METAKLFTNGRSQAVRLPKALSFDADVKEVTVEREGEAITLKPYRPRWSTFAKDAPRVDDDFLLDRGDTAPQTRHELP